MEAVFLDLNKVLRLHADLIDRYGGRPGVRDVGLLESAIAMPKGSFGGKRFHEDLFEMAAAYLFHIVRNHPFVDGNKRTGAASAIVFLLLNGVELTGDEEGLVEITLATVAGKADKPEIADFFRGLAE